MATLRICAHLLPREVQDFLKLSRATVYRYIKRGIIPAVKIGNAYRIPYEQFMQWYKGSSTR